MVWKQSLRASRLLVTLILLATAGLVSQAKAKTVLLDFSSPTCGPCRAMRPTVQRLAAAGYSIRHVDVTREPELAAQYRVTTVPTFIVLVDGQETGRVGYSSFEQLSELITRTQLRGQSPNPVSVVSGSGHATPLETSPATNNHKRLIEATVKISVEDSQGTSAGTGTIVDARSGEALILTCGHLFRSSGGKGPITVATHRLGLAGAERSDTTYTGRLIDFDLERDLALVSFRPSSPVRPVSIASTKAKLATGETVTTIGCNHGQNPTAIETRVTSNDRYQGPPNVEAAGMPVEGRSGGGLFNRRGELVGICFAADPQANEGLYASIGSIHAKLDSLGLATIYQSPAASSDVGSMLAIAPATPNPDPSFAIRGQNPTVGEFIAETRVNTNETIVAPNLRPAERAVLEEIARSGTDSEVICIIRPQQPGGKSAVISLRSASPDFVRLLAQISSEAGSSQNRVSSTRAAAAGQLLR